MSFLPKNWENVPIGLLCELKNGRAFKPVEWAVSGLPIVRIQNLNNHAATFNNYDGPYDQKHYLSGGELLFAWSGTPGTSFGAHVWRGGEALLNQHIFRVDFNVELLDRRFFRHAINQKLGELIDLAHGGAGLQHVTKGVFERTHISLPPRAEQTRIADKLDTVFTRMDAVNERLARVRPLLKSFRQSVLAAATSGRLTEEWRIATAVEQSASDWLAENGAVQRSRRKSVIRPRLQDLPSYVELPPQWLVTGIDELAADKPNALKAGPFGSALKKSMYVPTGYKVYGQEQVIAGDEKIGDYFITEAKYLELQSCAVAPGDILISLVGTIGKVLVLSPTSQPGIINPRLVKLSLHQDVNQRYFANYLRSPIALAFIKANSHGGTMDILNLGILRSLPILLPPPIEQAEIVRRVELLFNYADRLEARLLVAQTASKRLTPALLSKAFRGELVPQDPNDEPASELLRTLTKSRSDVKTGLKRARKFAT